MSWWNKGLFFLQNIGKRRLSTQVHEEERRRSQALAELDEAKSIFVSKVSHEFRTPLTLMLGLIEEMLAKPPEEKLSENNHFLKTVHRNGLRLKKLVNILLEISPINADRTRFLESSDVHILAESLTTNFKLACEKAELELVDFQLLHQRQNDVVLPSDITPAQKDSPRVLVVDDNADMRDYLQRLLGSQYQVETVADGETALEVIKNQLPDIIVSETLMPRLDGFALLKTLRADPHTTNIPFIMLTARAGEENHVDSIQSGADDYIIKPFSARILLASVSANLQMARLRREMNEAVQAVRKSEKRFRALTNATSDVVYRMCADWSEMWYLQGRQLIADTIEPSRTWVDQYIYPEDRELVNQAIQQAIQSKGVLEVEHRVFLVDGSIGWMHSRAIPILDRNDEIVEWFGAASDVTRRKEAEQALLEASRHKDEFLATLAHELRNPLAPLRNGLQIMRLAKHDAKAIEETQAVMERQLAQMVRLIDDLLDLSRISRGKFELQKEHVELAKVIQQALETSRPLIDAAEHELQLDMPSFPIYVNADVTRLAQVFANLLNNAAKYTAKKGCIKLCVQQDNNQVVVSILDNGVGIPAHVLPYIFEMFTQVDRQLHRAQGGLGIGLSLVKQLIEMHGGTVEVKSEGEDKGSEFIVRFPIVFSCINENKNTNEPKLLSNCHRILVVDDNHDAAKTLALMLEFMGHEIKTAHDGLEAINVAQAFCPDLILLDIGMPQLNGYEAAKKIRKQSWGQNITLVALTGWGQEVDRRRSQEAGFDLHITKPVKSAILEQLLANIRIENGVNRRYFLGSSCA